MKFDLKKNKKITFADVKRGEVFEEEGGYICMKTCEIEFRGTPINCVILDEGSFYYFKEDDTIVRIIKDVTLREE